MCGEADEPGGVGMCTRVGAATKLMSFTRDALRRCSGAQSAKPALGRAGGKAEQTAAVPAWVPWMGVLCRRSGQTQWMRGGCTGCAGCVSQWLLCRGEGVTCNGHEAERSAQADRGARGGRAVEGGCSLSRCAGAWPWWVFGRLVVGGPLGRSPLTLGGCAISGVPLVQALGDFWRAFGVGFVDWAKPGWNRTAKMPSRGPGQSRT